MALGIDKIPIYPIFYLLKGPIGFWGLQPWWGPIASHEFHLSTSRLKFWCSGTDSIIRPHAGCAGECAGAHRNWTESSRVLCGTQPGHPAALSEIPET